jgi:hypothetical protein
MVNEGYHLITSNVELGRDAGDPDAFWLAACSRLISASAPQHMAAPLNPAEELAHKSYAGISMKFYGLAAAISGSVFLDSGKRRHAEEYFNKLKETAEHSGQANLLIFSIGVDGVMAILDGRLEDALAIAQSMR